MMVSFSFAARMVDEVVRLVRSMEKHRYLREVDHRIHWTLDEALRDLPLFAPHAARFEARRKAEPALETGSRDPSLWRAAKLEEVVEVLLTFWGPGDRAAKLRERLVDLHEEMGLPVPEHEAFESNPEQPPFPELLLLDWTFLAVDQLDAERHAGALTALSDAGAEVDPSAPLYVEGPALTIVELCDGAPLGILADDFFLWAEPPIPYVAYVFRGVSKAAQLPEPPVGPDDDDDDRNDEARAP